MKKAIILMMVCVLVLAAGSAFAGISNSKHNLTSGNSTSSIHTTDTNATLCGFCHIPHGGNTSVAGAPLWGRQLPTTTYSVYGGGHTLGNTTVNQPGPNSLTCLSCHDGSIGLGVLYKNGVSTSPLAMTVGAGEDSGYLSASPFALTRASGFAYQPMIAEGGTDLTNDHPVGLQYDETKAGLDTIAAITGHGYKLYSYGTHTNMVECASCHDPHQDPGVETKFKRTLTGVTDFCVGCHAKK